MPTIQINSDNLREGLKKLGIPAAIVAAIVAYFLSISPVKYMTYEEYRATIEAYNAKIQEIKKDCENDKRCIIENGQSRVIFAEVKTKKDVIDKLNTWIEKDFKDPDAYKLKPRKQ